MKLSRFVAAIVFFSLNSYAFGPDAPGRLPDFDRRPAGVTNQPAGAAAKPAVTFDQNAAVARLQSRLPGLQVEFDRVSGGPKWISAGADFLSGAHGQGKAISAAIAAQFDTNDPDRATKAFLREHRDLFGHGPEALDKAKVQREFVTSHNGLRTVVWQQQVDRIPVFEAVLMSHTTRDGALVNLSSQFLPDPDAAASRGLGRGAAGRAAMLSNPPIAARAAVVIAARDVGIGLDENSLASGAATEWKSDPEQRQSFSSTNFIGPADVKLAWLPMDRETMRLCWDVILMSRARGEMFRTLVDAQTGEPLMRRCLTDYISDATYRVYTSDSPSPFSPSYSTPTNAQPPLTNRVLVTWPALDTNASPNGWINDGVNETLGNNVDAHTDKNADNVADLPRPHGSPDRVFDFPLDLAQAPGTYTNAAVVQLFYWNNYIHDRLYQLGFTEAAGNFQTTNFGRGGLGNDAVQADAQDGSGVNNANFSTPPDGSPGRMQMFIFNYPSPNRDGDLDAEIVLHEYTHGLSNRRVGGGVGISALQSGGLGEGWSDFYGMALLSEPGDDPDGVYASGGYATYQLSGLTQNYYFGIRRYPYCTDTNKNPLTFKDIDPAQASSHSGVPRSPIIGNTANEVHNMGEVWCMTLREARANLVKKYGGTIGNQLMLQLVTDGMTLSPANPNFLQARDAILQADQLDNGGADLAELWLGFAKRGMGKSATSPASSTTTGLVEAYDVPFQPLQLAIPASATEGDGVLTGAGRVSLPNVVSSNVVVQLSSSDTNEATVPASVMIPAGQTNGTFDVTIVDDTILDGTQATTITASANNFANAYGTLSVFDNETAVLQVVLPATVTEGQGTALGTVRVGAMVWEPVTVTLSSDDLTEIQVPATVIIPAGQTSAVFTVTVVDDNQIDGPQSAQVTAHVPNWTDGSASVAVLDNESLSLAMTLPASTYENAGTLTNAGSVSISGTLTNDLLVSLASGDPAKLEVPATATISAGQTTGQFNVTPVDNSLIDGHQTVNVTASAAGFTNGTASIFIIDDESPAPPSNPGPGHLAQNVSALTNLNWNTGGLTMATNELVTNGDFEAGALTGWTSATTGAGIFVINNGAVDPPSSDGPLPPFAGSYSALGEETGPGAFYLYQTVSIPANAVAARLSWAHRLRNFYSEFDSLQQFQVRVCDTNNNVLATAFTSNLGDPLLQDWVQTNYDLTAFAGQTVRVEFWVNPGGYFLDAHIDNVSLQAVTLLSTNAPGVTNDVYFGTNPTPGPAEFQGSTMNASWPLPLLSPQTTYYWQIIAHKGGTAAGPVWQFTTAGLDHFGWNTIASPQYAGQPFDVTITARDAFNQTVSNFVGSAGLSAATGGAGDNYLADFESGLQNFVINNSFGSGNGLWHWSTGRGSNAGHSPTHSLYYGHNETATGGGNYDTATANGGVVTSPAITLPAGTNVLTFNYLMNVESLTSYDQAFVEVSTNAGSTYLIVARKGAGLTYSTGGLWVSNSVSLAPFSGRTIFLRFRFDTIDSVANMTEGWYMDDISIRAGDGMTMSLVPTNTGSFTAGVWQGAVTVQQMATNVILTARDNAGHRGSSNPFDVGFTNDISLSILDSPRPVSVGTNLTYTLTVANTGPSDATGVMVTNRLPSTVSLVSAISSQGSCGMFGQNVVANLGVIPAGTNATVTLVVAPWLAGTSLTNVATVSRAEAESYLANNSAAVITPVADPAVSVLDAAVVEGNIGTTTMVFNVTLTAPSAKTVTVSYVTVDSGSAAAGFDYLSASGNLTLPPGTTNGSVAVAIVGDVVIETNETFNLSLINWSNASVRRSTAVGTIINDDGLPGAIDHFTWSVIASPELTGYPFAVQLTARDAANNVATNFNGLVSLSAGATNFAGANMNFEGGTLAPWTPLNLGNQPGPYELVSFDVDGDGLSSTAFRIAANSGTADGITQHVALMGGTTYAVSLDIATDDTSSGNNADGGTTAIMIGGSTVRQFSWGSVNIGNIYRTNLTGTFFAPTNGWYSVTLTFWRGYYEAGGLWCLADNLRIRGPGAGVAISPVTASLSQGIWTGTVAVLAASTNVELIANDGSGHISRSNPFDVTNAMAPAILVQPAGRTVLGGSNVAFTVTANGTPPLVYAWLKNGSLLPGETNAALTLIQVTRTNSGSYAVAITNIVGGVISSNAILLVHVPQRLGAPSLMSDGSISFTAGDADGGALTAEDLARLHAEASTNLVDWVELPGALTLSNGVVTLHDGHSDDATMRFYRIVEDW